MTASLKGRLGRPILEVLERQDVENTCIAVGALLRRHALGAAGLVRAYAAAAAAGLEAAGVATYVLHATLARPGWITRTSARSNASWKTWAPGSWMRYEEAVEVRVVTPVDRVDEVIEGIPMRPTASGAPPAMEDRFFPLSTRR